MEDTLQSVAHVVPAGLTPVLEDLGAEHVVEFPDVLSHGPSRRDPKDHREARLDYWRGLYERLLGEEASGVDEAVRELDDGYLSTEQLGSVIAHHAGERRVVIWSTPAFEDRLFLWMAFEAARSSDVSVDRIATAEPHVPVPPEDDDHYALRDLELGEVAEGFDNLIYPKEIYAQAGAQLWQTFASSSPRKFAISIPHTEKFFPNIATVGEQYGWLFPVVEGEGAETMELSELDSELLGALDSEQWRSPFELMGEEFVERFHFVDDLPLASRLIDWSEQEVEPGYVEAREVDAEGALFDRWEFRRTERGTELLESGFGSGDTAPIFEIGDCRIYASAEPWVKVVEGEHWWFERFGD